ncbi:nuclear transport factor 2 family protein [Patescibacteria group bacterium]|nr:nuclear transport factor 2 family protein [Patescibacteria group bacterium]MBU1868278.1 nuclear transport factor 2 family protein [Patescibacteria group bacterium]
MTKNDFSAWAEKFLKAWANLTPKAALSTLSKDVKYYESPFTAPCKSWEDVEKLWRVVPLNQKDITYKHDVLMIEEGLGLIHWNVTRTTVPADKYQEFDGVFLVRLNEKGLCTMFKQWRMINES